jgi:hypothetical protein
MKECRWGYGDRDLPHCAFFEQSCICYAGSIFSGEPA